MSRYEEGLELLDKRCGNSKDNLIALATISLDKNEGGFPCPQVRDLDAFYEDGVFYISTNAKSKKMKEIEVNNEVAFAVCGEWVSGTGIAENLGWVLEEKNSQIRGKIRKAFSNWYEDVGDEDNVDSIILAVRINKAIIIKDHGAKRYEMDFIQKIEALEQKMN